jgi:uncharacterized protein (TIGR00369 family)
MTKLKLEDDHYCFACGLDNPDGLRIEWITSGKTATATFIADRKYQGWKGILHGGIIATLLDEAMTRLAWLACGGALTAEMTIRFVAPAEIGKLLDIHGEIINERRKIVEMKATIHSSGTFIAHATGKAIKI